MLIKILKYSMNFTIVLKNNRNLNKKQKYNQFKREINNELFNNKIIKNLGKSAKNETKKFYKNITKISVCRKTEENIFKNKEQLSKIKLEKEPIKTETKKANNERKENRVNNIRINLNYSKTININRKIRKIKPTKIYLNSHDNNSIDKTLNNKKFLKNIYSDIDLKTNIYSKHNSIGKEKNEDYNESYFYDNDPTKED